MILTGLAFLTLIAWLYLTLLHGRFWSARIPTAPQWAPPSGQWPRVRVVVPARNEADVIANTVASILAQDYPGEMQLVVVDDHSDDGTADIAQRAAVDANHADRLTVLRAQPLPTGWTGKVWAMNQGAEMPGEPHDYVWFTDADILHKPCVLRELIARAEGDQRDLVSRMALLCTDVFWERLMIPAFVYFFQLLYPFNWGNNRQRNMAAAAGGCVLLRRSRLEAIGGVSAIRDALIDDCTLARKVKESGGSLWLELTRDCVSARGYGSLGGLWNMIARTAYTQLYYNPLILLGCVLGLGLTFLAPLFVPIIAAASGSPVALGASGLAWCLMTVTFVPMARFYFPKCGIGTLGVALALPLTALLYLGATIHSAIRYHRGVGGQWKGRAQAA
ncbi:MAG: glycosyltransferase [Puniceicoccales bacterium]